MNYSATQPFAALMGNPNSGKTAIFNLLTGLDQKVSNYPGITVERKMGTAHIGEIRTINILDLPGTYSITPESFDEKIVAEQVMEWAKGKNKPEVIISVIDGTNLSRNLFLTTQLMEIGIPVIIALNMMDRVKVQGKSIDHNELKKILGVADIIPMSARENWGIEELKAALNTVSRDDSVKSFSHLKMAIPAVVNKILQPTGLQLRDKFNYPEALAEIQALRLITRDSTLPLFMEAEGLPLTDCGSLEQTRDLARQKLNELGFPHRTLEATLRYDMLDRALSSSKVEGKEDIKSKSRSEKADAFLTHAFFGPLIFVSLLYFIFQSIFTWAAIPMAWIDGAVGSFGDLLLQVMPEGILRDILVNGVIAGVGAILIFLPQILFLMFFLTLLEDSGYMARVAFMMDRFMSKIGLHGKSVLPLMSGYACAIPGIMATRTIDNWKERLVTILVLPLMSCSARLPIYALMIGAFIPSTPILGIFNLQGLTMVLMYFLGTATAFLLAAVFSRVIKNSGQSSFVMELPPYRFPLPRSVFRQLYIRGKMFVTNAGKIIMAISIILWFLASFPKTEGLSSLDAIQQSYAGKIGHAIEPFIEPLGFDWKIGVGLITSFAAREVVVSTLATLYNIEGGGDDIIGITEALKNDVDPKTGLAKYTPLVALSLMVFYVYAAQCMATFAIVRNETNSWKWPLFMIVYMTSLAYVASLLVFQGGLFLGFS